MTSRNSRDEIRRDGNGLRVAEEQQKTIRFEDIAWLYATDWYDGLLMALILSPPHIRLHLKDGSAWNVFMDYFAFKRTRETADALETLRQLASP